MGEGGGKEKEKGKTRPLPVAKSRAAGEWATEMTEFWCPCRISAGPSSGEPIPAPPIIRRGSQNCTERSCKSNRDRVISKRVISNNLEQSSLPSCVWVSCLRMPVSLVCV